MNAMGSGVTLHRNSPWGSTERVLLSVGWTLAVCAVGFAWFATSDEAVLDDQVRWVAVAVAGMMVAGAVSGAWLLAGRRAVGLRARQALPLPDEGEIAEVIDLRAKVLADGASTTGADTVVPVAASGMRYFHRPECLLARGKPVDAAEAAEHIRAGRIACQVCRP